MQSQIRFHGYNPAEAIIEATPREVQVFVHYFFVNLEQSHKTLQSHVHCRFVKCEMHT